MKNHTKLLHLLWAVYWCIVIAPKLGWGDIRAEPHLAAIPVAVLAWLPFGVGLLWQRAWAWVGSFIFSTLSLFVCLYIAWQTIAIVSQNGWRGRSGLEFVFVVPAIIIVWLLLLTRHHYLKPHANAA